MPKKEGTSAPKVQKKKDEKKKKDLSAKKDQPKTEKKKEVKKDANKAVKKDATKKADPKKVSSKVATKVATKAAAKVGKAAAGKNTKKATKQPTKQVAKKKAPKQYPNHKRILRKKVKIYSQRRKPGDQASQIKSRIDKALRVQKLLKLGKKVRFHKIRTNVHFRRPRTLRLPKNPLVPRRAIHRRNRMDEFRILKYPLTTESAMKKIEDNNTLVFIVDTKSNKTMIRDSIKKMYDVKAVKVNTLIRPDGLKKAYVKLSADYDALDVANKIGII